MLHHTIIAEIGQNHCGDMGLAEKLIDLAKDNGADLVKFQLYDSRQLYGEYQPTELSRDRAFGLFEYGQKAGIEVFFSVFDKERVRWCEEMKVSHYKISCAMSTNPYLVGDVLKTRVPLILSSDIARPPDSRISALYCIPKYPASLSDLRFGDVGFINDFQGYSDHTIGLTAAKVALSRDAGIIEKHFAIDHETGIDAKWSMTPMELRELKRFADNVSEAL